jgi:hypothetical protein
VSREIDSRVSAVAETVCWSRNPDCADCEPASILDRSRDRCHTGNQLANLGSPSLLCNLLKLIVEACDLRHCVGRIAIEAIRGKLAQEILMTSKKNLAESRRMNWHRGSDVQSVPRTVGAENVVNDQHATAVQHPGPDALIRANRECICPVQSSCAQLIAIEVT